MFVAELECKAGDITDTTIRKMIEDMNEEEVHQPENNEDYEGVLKELKKTKQEVRGHRL